MTETRKRWLLIAPPALLAMALQLIATARFGAGLSPDSAVYIQSARQLAGGQGYTQLWASPYSAPKVVPVTWYPPGFPAMLALGAKLGIDPIDVARYTGAVLLGLCVALGAAMVWRTTRSIPITLVASILIALATDQLEAFSYALSEPLFIAATTLALIVLARFIERPTIWALIGAAICVSIAAMTRYIGLALVPMGALLIVFRAARPSVSRRLFDALLFTIIALVANVASFVRNSKVGGRSTGRELAWHPVNWTHGRDLFETIGQWIFPPFVDDHAWWLAAIALLVAGFTPSPRTRGEGGGEGSSSNGSRALKYPSPLALSPNTGRGEGASSSICWVLLTFIATYLLALAASISWIDAATPVDYRLLAPLFIPLVVLGAIAFHRSRRKLAMIFPILALCMITTEMLRTPAWVWRANVAGERLGYASLRWQKSRVMKVLPRLPRELPIWTNASDATSLRAGRVDLVIPPKFSRDGTQVRDDYPAAITALRESILKSGGAVILFDGLMRRSAPKVEDLDRDLHGLRRIEYPNDAVIWAHPSAARRFPVFTTPQTMPAR